mmetsp:Transcript_48246/g.140643  ORF Transcript_48246/g.140643 Transcript_48246/m.140643 type:complete len:213 (+) Transcript_48246:864-1502(+)
MPVCEGAARPDSTIGYRVSADDAPPLVIHGRVPRWSLASQDAQDLAVAFREQMSVVAEVFEQSVFLQIDLPRLAVGASAHEVLAVLFVAAPRHRTLGQGIAAAHIHPRGDCLGVAVDDEDVAIFAVADVVAPNVPHPTIPHVHLPALPLAAPARAGDVDGAIRPGRASEDSPGRDRVAATNGFPLVILWRHGHRRIPGRLARLRCRKQNHAT